MYLEGKNLALFKRSRFGTPICLSNQTHECIFIHLPVHPFCSCLPLQLCVHSGRVWFLNLSDTEEAPLQLMHRHSLIPALGFTLMNSLASLIRASWPEWSFQIRIDHFVEWPISSALKGLCSWYLVLILPQLLHLPFHCYHGVETSDASKWITQDPDTLVSASIL